MPLALKDIPLTSVRQTVQCIGLTLNLPSTDADSELVLTAHFQTTIKLQDGTSLSQPQQLSVTITQPELYQAPKFVGLKEDLIQAAFRQLKKQMAAAVDNV